jgi:hypothetical protein
MVYPDQGSVAALYLRATMPPCIFHTACSLVAVSRTVGEVLFDDALKTDFERPTVIHRGPFYVYRANETLDAETEAS